MSGRARIWHPSPSASTERVNRACHRPTGRDAFARRHRSAGTLNCVGHPFGTVSRTARAPVMKCTAVGLTDVGRRRQSNEDCYLVDSALGLFVVADGMGGHNAGEVASGEAVDALHGMVKREEEGLRSLEE